MLLVSGSTQSQFVLLTRLARRFILEIYTLHKETQKPEMSNKLTELEKAHINNRRRILRELRVSGAAARIDLANTPDQSQATVTEITSALISEGKILEVLSQKEQGRGRGRPKVLIELNPDYHHALGIKLTLDQVDLVLGDFNGHIISSETIRIKTLALETHSLFTLLQNLIDSFMARQEQDKFACIGLAVQGVADANSESIVWSYALAGRNIPIGEHLKAHYACPVTLINDANAITLALQQSRRFSAVPNLAVVMLGYGVGMGLLLDGKLYKGAKGASGEFGHTKFMLDGAVCHCGKRGCIEAYASDYAIYQNAIGVAGVPECDPQHPTEAVMKKIAQLARQGNEQIEQVYQQAGQALGFGLVNLIALYSPDKVFISGSGAEAWDLMASTVNHTVDDLLVTELRREVEIAPISWSDDLTEIGAVYSALLAWEDEDNLIQPVKKKLAHSD